MPILSSAALAYSSADVYNSYSAPVTWFSLRCNFQPNPGCQFRETAFSEPSPTHGESNINRPAAGGRPASSSKPSPSMPKPILLAIDDDISVLEAVVQDLRRHYGQNYRILRAALGTAALDICRQLIERKETVALFLSDQRMPGMTGVDFLQEAMKMFPDAKRVLLTAYADTEAAIRAINSCQNPLLPEQALGTA